MGCRWEGRGAVGRLMHTELLTFVFCRKCVCEPVCVRLCVCVCVCFVFIFCSCCIFAVAAVDSRYLLLLLKLLCVLLSALPWRPFATPRPCPFSRLLLLLLTHLKLLRHINKKKKERKRSTTRVRRRGETTKRRDNKKRN